MLLQEVGGVCPLPFFACWRDVGLPRLHAGRVRVPRTRAPVGSREFHTRRCVRLLPTRGETACWASSVAFVCVVVISQSSSSQRSIKPRPGYSIAAMFPCSKRMVARCPVSSYPAIAWFETICSSAYRSASSTQTPPSSLNLTEFSWRKSVIGFEPAA